MLSPSTTPSALNTFIKAVAGERRSETLKVATEEKAYVQQLEIVGSRLHNLRRNLSEHASWFVVNKLFAVEVLFYLNYEKISNPTSISAGYVCCKWSFWRSGGNGVLTFDMEYARWLDDHQRLINDVRLAVNSHVFDNKPRLIVKAVMSHYDEIFHFKRIASKSDVFQILFGMWKSRIERCFMWIGGFCSSELFKILGNYLEPLTDQQLMGICNLQAEGHKRWKLCNNSLLTDFPWGPQLCIVVDYMGHSHGQACNNQKLPSPG